MKLWELVDPFFDKQPEREFVKELEKPLHEAIPEGWNSRGAYFDEVELKSGVRLIQDFDDPKALLNTAYRDFETFLKVSGLLNGSYPIRIVYSPTECFEAYRIEARSDGCDVIAADEEGIRRALIYIEDEMLRREGPFLPKKPIQRKPFIKSRITRCFFSPTNRPPKNGEELGDDIDYYPDEYLNRLAHEGINGVWIYTHFRDLLPSKIIPEYGKDYKQRIEKLNKTIEKCAQYGIKVYILGVEPASTYRNQVLLEKHKELLGNNWGDEFYAFCTGNEKGRAYAEESTRTLFTLAPKLAGLIVISVGESCSHCASADMNITCPYCSDRQPREILAESVAALERGMHSVKPEAELISWPYGQRGWGKEAVIESASCVPENVILMHNFEDLGEEEQLGRKRIAIDYWLSYVGPSEMFEKSAKAARSTGRRIFAKLQVCCSHEVASVPYVPVPGILYKKYKAMHELGVDGAMQCWYFGNYPSIMGKAAGELSFEPFFQDEDSFLGHLAGIYWGSDADKAVAAWKCFEEGYRNFPINVAFDWYGPMHDAPVWPLQLIPKNLPLAGTWLTYDAVGGDRIGECMLCGHDIYETVILCERMSGAWKKGVEILKDIRNSGNQPWRTEQISIAKALDCQFESGLNILRFYMLRERLGLEQGNPEELLAIMYRIVEREIEISQSLCELCRNDKRLGYHSEGEGFKYFPDKLEWRIKLLEKLLETEFVEVGDRIKDGLVPLEYYKGVRTDSKRYICNSSNIETAIWEYFMLENGNIDEKTMWSASTDDECLHLRICCKDPEIEEKLEIRPEFRLLWPYPPVEISTDGRISFGDFVYYYSLNADREHREKEKWSIIVKKSRCNLDVYISLKLKDIGMADGMKPFRLNLLRRNSSVSKWVFSEYYCSRLIFGEQYQEELGWVVCK